MATQAAVKKASEPVKRKASPRVGGVKKPRVFDYARWRMSIQDINEFHQYYEGYPDKSGLMAYVYRLTPKINFSLIGRSEANIYETTKPEEMTAPYLLHKFGRGKYMICLNDANRPQGQKEVCKTWVKLEDEDKEAVYDIRTLVLSHPDNIDEVNRLVALGHLVREPSGAPRIRNENDSQVLPPAAPAGNGGGELISRDLVGQMLLRMIDKGSQSTGDMMKQSIEIAKLLAPPAAPPAPVLSVEQIAEQVAARLGRSGSAAEFDPFANYDRVESFMQRVRGGTSVVTDGGSSGGTLGSVATIIQGIVTGIPLVIMGIEKLRQDRTPAPGTQQRQNGPMPLKPLQDRIAEIATLGFQKMNEGTRGFDFAAWVCNWYEGGIEVYQFLEPGGTAGVIGLAAMNPATAGILNNAATRPQLEAFLDNFFTYDPTGGAGAGDDEAEESSLAASA